VIIKQRGKQGSLNNRKEHKQMRNRIAVFISIAMLACGSVYVAAQDKTGTGQRPPMQEGGMPHPPPSDAFGPQMMEHMARALNLTDAQKTEVKAAMDAARPTVEPLMKKQEEQHRQLEAATANGQFDEAQVRALATQQAQTMVDLTVEHERLKAKIYNLLTPEQRIKAQQMMHEHGGHPHPGGPEDGHRPENPDN
jgi:Spy/CpxP family protein refolding chaperone